MFGSFEASTVVKGRKLITKVKKCHQLIPTAMKLSMSPVDMFHVFFFSFNFGVIFFSEKKNKSPNTNNYIILHLHFCLLVSHLP